VKTLEDCRIFCVHLRDTSPRFARTIGNFTNGCRFMARENIHKGYSYCKAIIYRPARNLLLARERWCALQTSGIRKGGGTLPAEARKKRCGQAKTPEKKRVRSYFQRPSLPYPSFLPLPPIYFYLLPSGQTKGVS
jgi:hypothetical protein